MSWKDLYSEVKKRKMEALNKKDIVKAVEKHGKVLCINGRFEKPKKVINNLYASEKKIIDPKDVLKYNFDNYDLIIIGCPGDKIPTPAYQKIKDFVAKGGWILTTDWCIKNFVEPVFPGFIRWNKDRTEDAIVTCQIIEPNHPFLDGVISEIKQDKWTKKSANNIKQEEFKWWLEYRSFPIQILNHNAVRVLISSQELQQKWGESPVFCYFDYGQNGGRVIHMISHTHLQKGGSKGKYASALILTNILDEKITQKMGLSKNASPGYVSYGESPRQQYPQQSLEDQWVSFPQQDNYVTPSNVGNGVGLTGTSQIVEANDTNFTFNSKCVYCGYDFSEVKGKIYICKECSAPYHENCLNQQINEGVCKNCGRILLW